jgi:Cof subfamily protein (haloacid dehalogenase superfamily)
MLRAEDSRFGFSIATDRGFAHESGFAQRLPTDMETDPVDDALSIGGTEVYKLFMFHPERSVHDLITELPAKLPDHLTVTHMGADVAEIGPASIDKRAGLAWLCTELGVERADVIAFGDEWNDITMIEWAGHGVAMNNADSHVKAVADEIAPSNAADGVAIVLEALLAT